MIIRLHIGAKFQYVTPNNTAIVEVKNIAIVVDSETTETSIYFNNSIAMNGKELYCMTPDEFRKQLISVNAFQIA